MDGTQVGTEVDGNTNTSTSIILSGSGHGLRPTPDETDGTAGTEGSKDFTGIKSRAWMVTINNYTEDDIERLKNIKFSYLLWQKEVGKECKTPHLHAFLYYKNPVVWPKRFLPRARIEKVRSIVHCMKYCSKEETRVEGPWEIGEKPEQGRRKDLEAAAADYMANDEKTFAEENPETFVRFYKGLRELKAVVSQTHRDVNTPPSVIWLWGLAGVGKTRKAVETHKSFYIKDGTMWWDGYKQQEAIVIDDFDGKWPYRDLLRLLDRYEYQGQVKGGYVKINSPHIYITCEFEPEHFWKGNELAQVMRRITKVELIGPKPPRLDGADRLIAHILPIMNHEN